jgi:hypothetical protein
MATGSPRQQQVRFLLTAKVVWSIILVAGEKKFWECYTHCNTVRVYSMVVENVDAVPDPLTTSTNLEEGR